MKFFSKRWVFIGAVILLGLVLWIRPGNIPLIIPLFLDTLDILSGKETSTSCDLTRYSSLIKQSLNHIPLIEYKIEDKREVIYNRKAEEPLLSYPALERFSIGPKSAQWEPKDISGLYSAKVDVNLKSTGFYSSGDNPYLFHNPFTTYIYIYKKGNTIMSVKINPVSLELSCGSINKEYDVIYSDLFSKPFRDDFSTIPKKTIKEAVETYSSGYLIIDEIHKNDILLTNIGWLKKEKDAWVRILVGDNCLTLENAGIEAGVPCSQGLNYRKTR